MTSQTNARGIDMYDIDRTFLRHFNTAQEAASFLVNEGHEKATTTSVWHACSGKMRICYDYRFKYDNEPEVAISKEYDPLAYDNDDWTTWKCVPNYSAYRMSKLGQVYSHSEDRVKDPTKRTQFFPTARETGMGPKDVESVKYARELYSVNGLREDYVGTFFPITEAPGYYVNAEGDVYHNRLDKIIEQTTEPSGRVIVRLNVVNQDGKKTRPVRAITELVNMYVPI